MRIENEWRGEFKLTHYPDFAIPTSSIKGLAAAVLESALRDGRPVFDEWLMRDR